MIVPHKPGLSVALLTTWNTYTGIWAYRITIPGLRSVFLRPCGSAVCRRSLTLWASSYLVLAFITGAKLCQQRWLSEKVPVALGRLRDFRYFLACNSFATVPPTTYFDRRTCQVSGRIVSPPHWNFNNLLRFYHVHAELQYESTPLKGVGPGEAV